MGDWRLFFLYRDRLRKVTLADVQRVAEHYLKPANRVLGEFIPNERPDRAEIPPTPDLQAALAGYEGGEGVRLGEAFDPSPQEHRVAASCSKDLSNGIRAALLPKQTRGGRVVATLTLHWGDEKSLTNRETACNFAGAMLMRGTRKRSRAELKEAFEQLNAAVSLSGDGASIEVRGENLIPALRLVAEALREPAFPREEFEEMKRAALTGAEAQRNEPSSLASVRLARHLHEYAPGHPALHPDGRRAHRAGCARRRSRTRRPATASSSAPPARSSSRSATSSPRRWRARSTSCSARGRRRARSSACRRCTSIAPRLEDLLVTPDKANATLRAGLNVRMRDDHPDFPALVLANHLLGGSSTARVPLRVREKEGLSYSTYTTFSSSALDEPARSAWPRSSRRRTARASSARSAKSSARAVREGFSAEEVEDGKRSVLEARRLARAQDRALAGRLGHYLFVKRTFAWDVEFEAKIAALTPQQVNAALQAAHRPGAAFGGRRRRPQEIEEIGTDRSFRRLAANPRIRGLPRPFRLSACLQQVADFFQQLLLPRRRGGRRLLVAPEVVQHLDREEDGGGDDHEVDARSAGTCRTGSSRRRPGSSGS